MMKKNRQQRFLLLPFFLASGFAIHLTVAAAEEDVSQKDPQRWYEGDTTASLHNKNLIKEARAAYAQALRECKTLKSAEAKACRKDARENLQSDLARAKRIYKKNTAGG